MAPGKGGGVAACLVLERDPLSFAGLLALSRLRERGEAEYADTNTIKRELWVEGLTFEFIAG